MPRPLRSLILCLSMLPLAACPRPDEKIVIAPEPAPPKDPQLIELGVSLSKATLEADQPQEVFARLRVSGKQFEGHGRPRVNLALALDVSGSMQGEALDDAKDAALAMVDALEEGDQLAIVVFGGKAEQVFASQPINPATRATAKSAIAEVEAKGTTDMLNGMAIALGAVQNGYSAEGVNRIVLLSDGVPNVVSGIEGYADQARNSGVSITALGLGLEFDETLLTMISQRSGGRYHYLESSDEAVAVFNDELLHMERSIARSTSLSMRAGPGVEILEVVGHPGAAQATQATVSLGDIADDEVRDVIVRLRAPAHLAGSHAEILDAFLNFEDVAVGASWLTREAYLSATVGEEVDTEQREAAQAVELAAARAIAAAAIVEVAAFARDGRTAEAMSRLGVARERAAKDAERFDDEALRELVAEMKRLHETWPKQPPAIATDGKGGPVSVLDGVQREPDMPDARPSSAPVPAAQPDPQTMRRSHAKALETLR